MSVWITLYDPKEHPGASLSDRHKIVVKQAMAVAENHLDKFPALQLPKSL